MKLDKKTAAALSGLDFAIAATLEAPQQPDEFTVAEFVAALAAKGQRVCTSTAAIRLKKMADDGELTQRSTVVGRIRTRVYRRA